MILFNKLPIEVDFDLVKDVGILNTVLLIINKNTDMIDKQFIIFYN